MADPKIPLADLPYGLPGAFDRVAGVDTATGAAKQFPMPQAGEPKDYPTRASLPSASGLTDGTAAHVNNDPNPDNNGRWAVFGGQWVQSADRVTGIEGELGRIGSSLPKGGSLYPDPDMVLVDQYSGAAVVSLPNSVYGPAKNYVRSAASGIAEEFVTPAWHVTGLMGYRHIGRVNVTGTTTATVSVVWYSDRDGVAEISSEQIAVAGNPVVFNEVLQAPASALRARFRVSKTAGAGGRVYFLSPRVMAEQYNLGAAVTYNDNWDDINGSGLYFSLLADNMPGTGQYLMEHMEGLGGRAIQVAFYASSAVQTQPWVRYRTSTGQWTPWVEFLTTDTGLTAEQAPRPFSGVSLETVSSVVAVERPGGQLDVLFSKAPELGHAPASLVKMLTAMVAHEALDAEGLDWTLHNFTVQASDATTGSGNNLEAGDIITARDAIVNLMLPSSNVSASVIAREVGALLGGTVDPVGRFVAEMNAKAAALGAEGTNCNNPHGLPSAGQLITALGAARIALAYSKNPDLAQIWAMESATLSITGPNARQLNVESSVSMVADPDVLGGKTGSIAPSTYNLALQFQMGSGERAIYVGLRSSSTNVRYADARRAIDGIKSPNVTAFGAFGGEALPAVDFDALTMSGIYRGEDGKGHPMPGWHAIVRHDQGEGGRGYQVARWAVGSGTEYIRMSTRFRDESGAWTSWQEIHTSETVGQYGRFASDVDDFDALDTSGIYHGASGPGHPQQGAYAVIHHDEGYSGRAYQRARWAVVVNGVTYSRTATRFRGSNGAWTEWARDVDAGAPTRLNDTQIGSPHVEASQFKIKLQRSAFYTMPTDEIYTSASDLNGRYLALADEFPDYVTSRVIGEDAWGNSIMEFSFKAPGIIGNHSPYPDRATVHPKICIVSGVHPLERPAMVSTLCLMDDLCRHWQSDEMLTQLRWGAEIVVVPVVNPSGVNSGHIRRNGNGVDINRNFPHGWPDSPGDPDAGPSAGSEAETQIMMQWAQDHSDAIVVVDHHSHENNGYPLWYLARPSVLNDVLPLIRQNHGWLKREYLRDDGNTSRVALSSPGGGYMATQLVEEYGLTAFVIEGPMPSVNEVSHLPMYQLREIYVRHLLFSIYHVWRG